MLPTDSLPQGSILGHAVARVEDARFLTGEARYTEDLVQTDALHAAFVRSPVAHARVESIDTSAAVEMPGVAAVLVSGDLDLAPIEVPDGVPQECARPILAPHTVRFAGEAVAMVVAETRAQAIDAAEAVLVDYEMLDAVIDPESAAGDRATVLFTAHGSNVVYEVVESNAADPLEGAEVVVRGRFLNQRLAAVPMETSAALAVPDGPDALTVWLTTQAPFLAREAIATSLAIPEESLRVVAPAVGGGFGAKISTYPEQIAVAAAARKLGRPVRYIESRSENLLAMTQGRAQIQDVGIGATRAGRITGLEVRVIADCGAYPADAVEMPELTGLMACGVYDIPKVDYRARCVVTNSTPISAYRGAGRPEATALIERVVDMLARELDLDPIELRKINLVRPDAFPHETVTGATYDVGEYATALETAAHHAGYQEVRAEQERRRGDGAPEQLGIGVCAYVEITGWGSEFGAVEVQADGMVRVRSGISPHGQGHETSLAQIASSILRIPMEMISVLHSDTAMVPRGGGTMGSRSLQKGGSAVHQASRLLVDKAQRIAAHLLETSVEDISLLDDGRVGVTGAPNRSFSWSELARLAQEADALPEGETPGLETETDFKSKKTSFPFGAHVSVVEVDTETGDVRILKHVAVDDCGTMLNPMLVEGQVHGGVAQGIAQALYEQVVYDEWGNNLTGNLANYAMPTAFDLPAFERIPMSTPTPLNPLGAKGIGESGTIGSMPAVQNAVVDALSHLGVAHIDTPFTPENVWRALNP